MVEGRDISADETLSKHAAWADEIKAKYDINAENIDGILKAETGKVFASILEQCGVFSRDENGKKQFLKFIASVR